MRECDNPFLFNSPNHLFIKSTNYHITTLPHHHIIKSSNHQITPSSNPLII